MDVNANIDVGKNITQLLEKLAVQIGTTADKIFPWYVKQQVIEGWASMGAAVLGTIIFSTFFVLSYPKADFDKGNGFVVTCIICGIFTIIGICFVVFGAPTYISQIANPNYYAIKSLTADMARLVGK